MFAEEAAGEVHIFGRDPHALAGPGAQRGRDIVEIGHRTHVDPGAGHGHHHIGIAEPERCEKSQPALGVRDRLAYQILAGDAEMRASARELRRDLGGRKEKDFDIFDAFESASIIAQPPLPGEAQARPREESVRSLLQPALRGNGDDEPAHCAPAALGPATRPFAGSAMRSSQIEQPTAGTSRVAPRRPSKPS